MKKSIYLSLAIALIGFTATGQTSNDTKLESAERLRKEYRFHEAIEIYKEILSESSDSLYINIIQSLIAKSENGINMLLYASHPVVTGRFTAPLSHFFLYYPGFNERLWRELPPDLSKGPGEYSFPPSALIEDGESVIYYSALNDNGDFDIYRISRIEGDLWSYPEPLNSLVNSSGDELFPFLSRDGKHLFFSSTGHFGIGGFDLYVSSIDKSTNDWGLPQNMGFPYSSVDDDLLLYYSPDGLNTYVASNRNTLSRDSIEIYRLDFENNPVKRAVSSIDEATRIVSFSISGSTTQFTSAPEEKRDVMTTPETDEYTRMIMEVRRIQRSIDSTTRSISANRMLYGTFTESEERAQIERRIYDGELALLDMQSRLRVANEVVQKREMEFLKKGTLIPRSEEFFAVERSDTIIPEQIEVPFILLASEFAPFPEIEIHNPVQLFDYTFRVEEESVMAEDSSYPNALVYRIQIFTLSTPRSDLKVFKGLSPIFENRNSQGRWVYTAGQFFTHQEAADALATVKRAGFPSAIVVAFDNGKSTPIRSARTIEQERVSQSTWQIRIDGYPAGMPQPVIDIIRSNTDRDIAKKMVEGKEIFLIGPFSNKIEAEQLITIISGLGAPGVLLEEIVKEN
ncbi:MAG: hypothetical protein Q8R90_08630 [Bacteroidales bacterium]|nr:hypothetical protein [Bacteroidales bacterium]